jgi:uncharacterized protein YndB with AHSA1/START domain
MVELNFKLVLNANIIRVWNAWTDPNQIYWFAKDAKIHLKKNGKYELVFNDEHSTQGCRIVNLQLPYFLTHQTQSAMLEFSWKGHDDFDIIMNFPDQLTTVKLLLKDQNDNTELNLKHYGWKSSEDWQDAREWHNKWWPKVIQNLTDYLIKIG